MKSYGKRLTAFVLMFLMCTVSVFGNVSVASATEVTDGAAADTVTETTEDGKTTVIVEHTGVATANTEVLQPFTVEANNGIGIIFMVQSPCNAVIGIVDSANNWYSDGYAEYAFKLSAENWAYDAETGLYYYEIYTYLPLAVGDYYVSLETEVSTQYMFYGLAANLEPEISQTKMTLSVGIKEKLTVENTDEKITWKSSKKSVATVNSKGVVTGKKAGKATITATTESGVVLKCKVTVKANKFTETKLKVSDLSWNEEGILQVYSASYDAKGNLVIKCRFINNCGYTVTKLEGIKIKMISIDGKTIGTYTASSKKMGIADGKVKDFSVTIKKSKLKIKNADLRNATYTTDGQFIYNYYY